MDVDAMKYPQLRSLAKELGLKSTNKADKLRKTIHQHFEQQQQLKEEQVHVSKDIEAPPGDVDSTQDGVGGENGAGEEAGPKRSGFVTQRRGKTTKRKMVSVDVVADSAGKQPLATEKGDPEEVETEALAEGERAKKRRVSAAQEPEPTGPAMELQTEVKPDPAVCDRGTKPTVGRAGKIPRHEGLLKKNKPLLKSVTPNFKKLHQAQFEKMESIDSYAQRKTQKAQELKLLSEKTVLKADGKQLRSRVSLMSPAVATKQPASMAVQREASFRPSILSTRRVNVRFSEATLDNGPKKSLLKTPVRLSTPCVAQSTPGRQTGTGAFVFTGDTSFSGTNNKPSFNLKASLSKTLSYKPHKGKLKPFGEAKENTTANTSMLPSHQKNYKQHQVQTRQERRTEQTQDRKQKKEVALGARRGLMMS